MGALISLVAVAGLALLAAVGATAGDGSYALEWV